jgi:hypothetical protein
MTTERANQPPRDKPAPQPPLQQKGQRSGEGARSIIPHLKADMRARAVGKIAKRRDREL